MAYKMCRRDGGIVRGVVDGGQGERTKERGRVLRGETAGIGKVFALH